MIFSLYRPYHARSKASKEWSLRSPIIGNMKLRALYLEETSRLFFTRPNQVTTLCSDVVFSSYEQIVLFLDGYHPVDLAAKKVGNIKEFLIGNGVVETLDADIDASAKIVPNDRLCVRLFDAKDGSDVNRKLGIPLVEEVYISCTVSPRLFWVQLKSNSDAIFDIQDQLESAGNFLSCHFTFPSDFFIYFFISLNSW